MPKKSYLSSIRTLRIGAGVKFADGLFITDSKTLQHQIEGSELFGVRITEVPIAEVAPEEAAVDNEIDFFPIDDPADGPEPVADPVVKAPPPPPIGPWYTMLTATDIVTMKVDPLKDLAGELAVDYDGLKAGEIRAEVRLKLGV